MNEIENIKVGLTYLLDINDLKNNVTVTEDGKSHSMNVKDLKEANYDVLLQIAEALDRGKCWLKQKNGGAINLRFVASYSPYKFYPRDDYRPGKQKR